MTRTACTCQREGPGTMLPYMRTIGDASFPVSPIGIQRRWRQHTVGLLAKTKKPLYAVKTEALAPPISGWKKFGGAVPLPIIDAAETAEGAAGAACQSLKEEGNALFAAKRYVEAEAKWSRALEFISHLGESDQVAVALFANRAEARLRGEQWELALADANAALSRRPDHDKALLRAAVATRELKRVDEALALVKKCVDAHPRHAEAKQMLRELEESIEEERRSKPGRTQAARTKWANSLKNSGEGALGEAGNALSARDQNNEKGLKAFEGYADKRGEKKPRPPLTELPYHKMGLPQDQIDLMDKFFQEMREKKDKEEAEAKEKDDAYRKVTEEFRLRAQAEDATAELEGPQGATAQPAAEAKAPSPSTRPPPEAKPAQQTHGWGRTLQQRQALERVRLTQSEKNEIDALFGSAAEAEASAIQASASKVRSMSTREEAKAMTERQRRLQEAQATIGGRVGGEGNFAPGPRDNRTARERELDEEEALEARQRKLDALGYLQSMKSFRRGEPHKFEQAAGEVYAWWTLPAGVSGKEVKVQVSKFGGHLKVTARDVAIFDRPLFKQVRGDDVVWSIEDGDLHLTLTKMERNQVWDQLGEEVEILRDEQGEPLEHTIPEPMSSADRIDNFRQMIQGDDGERVSYDDLTKDQRHIVDVIRRYEHARATGDKQALLEAELDMEEMGPLVV